MVHRTSWMVPFRKKSVKSVEGLLLSSHHQYKTCEMYDTYHSEMKEQNSGENWSAGAQGGGWSTMVSMSSYTFVHPSPCCGGEYGKWPNAHSSKTNPKLQMSLE